MERRAPARLSLLVALPVAAATLAVVGLGSAGAATPGPNGPIVFVSDRDSVDANANGKIDSAERNQEIYSINPDGTGLRRLTNDPATDTRPAASPNGKKIAFDSNRHGNYELELMGVDGSGTTRVTDRGASDVGPSFSASGQRLAYAVRHASTLAGAKSEGDIWTANTDGTETTRLTFDRELDEFDPDFSPDGTKIAFTSGTPGGIRSSYDIVVINSDGSGMVNLTATSGGSGAEDSDPAFSPDGTKITFTSDRGGGTEIWVMGADGTNPTQLTNASGRDEHPSFSPDGKLITFTARRAGSVDLYTMAADGSAQTRLTNDAPLDERDEVGEWMAITPAGEIDTYIDSGPSFVGSAAGVSFSYSGAPALNGQVDGYSCRLDGGGFSACPSSGKSYSGLADGPHSFEVRATSNGAADTTPARYRFEVDTTRIAFASDRDGNSEIYLMSADGTAQSRLTNNAATDSDPALSPDGSTVAFASDRDGDQEIYLSAAAGGPLQKLTDNSAQDGAPSFSPDGSTIFFTSARDGNNEIYSMDAASGSAQTNLTTNPANDRDPSLSPNGATVVFESDRAAGNEDIYSMAANGSGVLRLTTNAAPDNLPDFSPDGTKIAFTRDVSPGPGLPSDEDVWVMGADGSAQTNITNHPRGIDDRQPSWRPDGAKIAYQDEGDIYIQNPDGKARTRLTAVAASDSVPDWGVASSSDPQPTVPQTTITSGPAEFSAISDPRPSFSFSSDQPSSTFECRFDSAAFAACSGAGSHSPQAPLADGAHTFAVRAIDGAGTVDDSPATRTFTVDTARPQTTITAGPAELSTISDPSPSFSFASNEAGATFECRFDAAAFAACSSAASHTPQAPLADGPHTFAVRAVDGAGNVDDSPASRSFTVDAGPGPLLCQGEEATIVAVPGTTTTGTAGNDVIVGTAGADNIRAKSGADLICALGGDDEVSAAGGDDTVHGGAGADLVAGGGGTDSLFGGDGRDNLDGESGHDALDGGADWDICQGGAGRNTLINCEA